MVIRSLMGGGAERVMSTMANYWVARGFDISIITSVPPELDAYTVDPRVKRIWLQPSRYTLTSRVGFPWSIRALRRQIRAEGHPIVVSFMDRSNIPVLLATRGMGIALAVAERIDPRTQRYSLFKRFCMRACYPWADAVVVQTENVKKEWAECFVPPRKVHVIHNPMLPPVVNPEAVPGWLPTRFLCCVGRLHPQKGFDLLFKILPELFARWPEYHLVILGEGENRAELEAAARRLGIAHRVFMPGFIQHPHAIMQRASLFIFPSRFEGFPNALIEAMALGLPAVSFDCPSGPSCLIRHGINGLLVPPQDTDALAEAINFMLRHPDRARAMGKAALQVKEQCNIEKVMSMWEDLLDSLLEKRPHALARPYRRPTDAARRNTV